MARIVGVDIPNEKRVIVSLTSIYGINKSLAKKIVTDLKINPDIRVKDLTEQQLTQIRREVVKYEIEGDLRRKKALSIKRLIEIGSYRGLRHRRNLPVRGQSSKQNARTRKRANGPKKTLTNKKK